MRVAVLGAGYAGLTVARRLERMLPESAALVVVNDDPAHLVQHELHRLIRYPDLRDAITVPLEDILGDAEFVEGEVVDVDPVAGEATLADEDGQRTLEYDLGAVCLGAETEFYGLEGVEEHATPLKRVAHAEAIREQALATPDGTAVVGGGGLSGVQAAGELAAMPETDLDVTLVEMADQIAPNFEETFAAAIREELEARGVTVKTSTTVASATAEAVHLEDTGSLPADVFVWAGGIRGPAALSGERSPTAADLRVSESTFVLGDAAAVTDDEGESVPASAQTATRQARVAARNIARLAAEEGEASEDEREAADDLATYNLDSPGWVVSVGNGAVATVGPVVFSGEPAKAAKAAIGAGHLGSIGAIRQASELVAEELGWPTPPAVGFEGKSPSMLPTDPASPSEVEYPLSELFIGMAETVSDEPIDLTAFTRGLDPSHPENLLAALDPSNPDSPMRSMQDSMFDFLGSDDEEPTGGTTIEVTGESDEDDSEQASDDEDDSAHASDDEDDGSASESDEADHDSAE
jgi:NADH dehydrogenase